MLGCSQGNIVAQVLVKHWVSCFWDLLEVVQQYIAQVL